MPLKKPSRSKKPRPAAAEQRRKEAEAAAAKALADKQAAEKALADKLASERTAAEPAGKQAAEKAAPDTEQRIAAIAPPPAQPTMSPQEMSKLLQSELRRVGCLTAAADGDWNATSQRSLSMFNQYAGTKLDAKLASFDALDAIKAKPGRVCPLVCERGFKADGDSCVKITCRAGYRVNGDNECEKVQERKPVAARDDSKKQDAERKQIETAPSKPQASGQIICNSAGCREVAKGCRIERTRYGSLYFPGQAEVCN